MKIIKTTEKRELINPNPGEPILIMPGTKYQIPGKVVVYEDGSEEFIKSKNPETIYEITFKEVEAIYGTSK